MLSRLARLQDPAALVVVFAWGINFSIIKIAYTGFDPSATALIRYLGMIPCMILLSLLLKERLSYKGRNVPKLLLAGFLSSGLYMVFFLEGLKTAGAAESAIALATAPLWIAILAVASKRENANYRLAVGSLLAFAGVAILILASNNGNGGGSLWGIGLVALSAFVWATSVIVMNDIIVDGDPIANYTLSMPGAAIILVPWGLASTLNTDYAAVSTGAWLSMGYLIAVAGMLAFGCYYIALRRIGPSALGLTQYLIPIVAVIAAVFMLGEPLTLWHFLGMLIVIAGVAIGKKGVEQKLPAEPGVTT